MTNKTKTLSKFMKQLFFTVAALALFLLGLLVGQKTTKAYEKIDNSQVEYASETDNKFYQKMTGMERNTTLEFNGFPASLTSILFKDLKPREEILNCGDDTLILVSRDLDRTDINKYPYYIIKDTKNNYWSIYRRNDKFLLTRQDEKKYEELPE